MKIRLVYILALLALTIAGCSFRGEQGCPISMDSYIEYRGEKVKLRDLLSSAPSFYACADIDGDGIDEVGFVSQGIMYLVDTETNSVVYEGVAYEKLLDCNGYRGLIYQRDGGAPKNVIYQYFVLEENYEERCICTWGCYDINDNELFDEQDLYLIDGEEKEYAEWKELTASYFELVKVAKEWREIDGSY